MRSPVPELTCADSQQAPEGARLTTLPPQELEVLLGAGAPLTRHIQCAVCGKREVGTRVSLEGLLTTGKSLVSELNLGKPGKVS